MYIDEKLELLKSIGCENVDSYMLVNNYGYTFTKGDLKFDLRHWLNCYGADVNYWSLDAHNILYTKDYVKLEKGTFNTFDDAVEFIKILMEGSEK